MLAMQELGCFQELLTDLGIIMLQHEVMVDLMTVSLCIQYAINNMHLCLLSITYACPYRNPTATLVHSIHNVDISKPLTHTTPHMMSALNSEKRDSSVKRTPRHHARHNGI